MIEETAPLLDSYMRCKHIVQEGEFVDSFERSGILIGGCNAGSYFPFVPLYDIRSDTFPGSVLKMSPML